MAAHSLRPAMSRDVFFATNDRVAVGVGRLCARCRIRRPIALSLRMSSSAGYETYGHGQKQHRLQSATSRLEGHRPNVAQCMLDFDFQRAPTMPSRPRSSGGSIISSPASTWSMNRVAFAAQARRSAASMDSATNGQTGTMASLAGYNSLRAFVPHAIASTQTSPRLTCLWRRPGS